MLEKQKKKHEKAEEKINQMICSRAAHKNYWEDLNELKNPDLDAVMLLFDLDDTILNENNKKVKMKVDDKKKAVKEIEPVEKELFDFHHNANSTRCIKITIHLKQIEKALNEALFNTFNSVPEEDHIT